MRTGPPTRCRRDGADWLELLETVLAYKLPHLTREEILTMFELRDIELKQTRFCQQAAGEGMEKGRAEGEAALPPRQLERRFGTPPAAARRRIADADALLRYAERVLDAKSLEEVFSGNG